MQLVAGEPMEYLVGDMVVEVDHPAVRALSGELRAVHPDDVDFTRAAFEWVRDRIRHSVDAQDPRITVTAGEVLSAGVGLCYAKSHLLVAVARAAGVPAGLCYQQLTDGGEPSCTASSPYTSRAAGIARIRAATAPASTPSSGSGVSSWPTRSPRDQPASISPRCTCGPRPR